MKIDSTNYNITKIPFKSQKTGYSTCPFGAQIQPENLKKAEYTPDYNIKTPQKYVSQGVYNVTNDIKVHFYKLENGQRVAILPKEGPTVVKTYVNVGSMNESDEQRGISHFVEHSLFNGSEGLEEGEFFENVNKLGGTTNAATSFSTTNYYISSNLLKDTDLEDEIKLHASMIETPKFTNEMIEKEKGPVISEINMITDNSGNLAINHAIKNLFNIKTTSDDLIGGTSENINNLTREKVLKYYKENYYPANMVTVITGDVDPDSTMNLISKYFQGKAGVVKNTNVEKFEPINQTVRNDIVSPKANRTEICLAFVGPQNNNTKDKILFDAFAKLMLAPESSSSRLTKALENIQSYANISIDRIGTRDSDNRVITIDSTTTERSCEKVLNTIYNEIQNLETNPPTEEELEIIKKHLKLSLIETSEYSSSLNSFIGNAMLDNDKDMFLNYSNIVDSITSQDIIDFTKKYFDLNKVAITIVHPTKNNLPKTKSANVNFGSSINNKKYNIINAENVDKYLLPNNIELYTNNINKDFSVAIFSLETDKPIESKPGTSKILSLMIDRMLGDKEFFDIDLDKLGIKQYVSVSNNDISVCSKSLSGDTEYAIKSMKKILLNPSLTEENLEFAKAQIRESLQNINPSSTSSLISELYKGQRHSVSEQDIKKSLDSITLDDVKKLYNDLIASSHTVCAISGPTKDEQFKNMLLTELCYDFPTFKPVKLVNIDSYKPVDKPSVVIKNHEKSQAEVELGYKFKTNENLKDSVIVILLNTILGGTASSRLFTDLREKQKLAYHVASKIYTYDNSDVLSLFIKTTTDDKTNENPTYDNLEKSLNGFKEHINKLMTENVTEEELENAKKVFKNKILNNNESTVNKSFVFLSSIQSPYGVELYDKSLEIVNSITPDDIRNAANYIFNTKPAMAIVATKDTIDHNKEFINKFVEKL